MLLVQQRLLLLIVATFKPYVILQLGVAALTIKLHTLFPKNRCYFAGVHRVHRGGPGVLYRERIYVSNCRLRGLVCAISAVLHLVTPEMHLAQSPEQRRMLSPRGVQLDALVARRCVHTRASLVWVNLTNHEIQRLSKSRDACRSAGAGSGFLEVARCKRQMQLCFTRSGTT